MTQLMSSSGITVFKNNQPHQLIEDLLYRLSSPIYYNVAKENRWSLSWVYKKRPTNRGDYWEKDTVLRVTFHPLSKEEIQNNIYQDLRDLHITILSTNMKDGNKEREAFIDNFNKLEDKYKATEKKFIAFFKEDLKKEKVIDIDNNFKVLCKDKKEYKKKFLAIVHKITDPQNTDFRVCDVCGKYFPVKSKHGQLTCPGSKCRTRKYRANKELSKKKKASRKVNAY